jgi:hypothetical protein
MIRRRGFSFAYKTGAEAGDDPVVLGMHGQYKPQLFCPFKHAKKIRVGKLKGIGGVRLVTGDASGSEGFHHFKHTAVNVLQHAVKAVIYDYPAFGKAVVFFYLVIQGTARGPKSRMVHYGCRSPESRRDSTRVKVIACNGDAHIKAKMGVNVNASWDHDLSRCVDDFDIVYDFSVRHFPGKVFSYAFDFFSGTENVAHFFGIFRYDKAVFDKNILHALIFPEIHSCTKRTKMQALAVSTVPESAFLCNHIPS